MAEPMIGRYDRLDVITSVQRPRRWSAEKKVAIVKETHLLGRRSPMLRAATGWVPTRCLLGDGQWRRAR